MTVSAVIGVVPASAQPPRLLPQQGGCQLEVGGKPFLILGGELGNSSAGTAAQAYAVLPPLAADHFNTVLLPVSWGEIEPRESSLYLRSLSGSIDSAVSPWDSAAPL